MKAFNRIFAAVMAVILMLAAAANILLLTADHGGGRAYRVEIERLARAIEESGFESVSLADCKFVTHIIRYDGDFYDTDLGDTDLYNADLCDVDRYDTDFYDTDSDYVIRKISGELYHFGYQTNGGADPTRAVIIVNVMLGMMAAVTVVLMLYLKYQILKPFEQLKEVPYELSKGNLTVPMKETKNRFFGRFIWGVNVLRENMEQQKERELALQRDKKVLLLSLSHDIKTPLSAIKLYAKALSKGLYEDREKQTDIADHINAKADEIEGYVSQIVTASREDFLSLEVNNAEFYLSVLMKKIKQYYAEKLALIGTDFSVSDDIDCLINGDLDRSVEVLQNMVENAVKYGDGRRIAIGLSEEDGCTLITVSNSGCTLDESDIPNMFNSFWRGTNAAKEKGSGLGLYICRQLMHKMNGEIFAEIKDGFMCVTAVFAKA